MESLFATLLCMAYFSSSSSFFPAMDFSEGLFFLGIFFPPCTFFIFSAVVLFLFINMLSDFLFFVFK